MLNFGKRGFSSTVFKVTLEEGVLQEAIQNFTMLEGILEA